MSDLVDDERRLWIDSADAFADLCDPKVVMVLPMERGILDRGAALASLSATPRWRHVTFSAVYESRLGDGLVLLCYQAEAERDGDAYRALCSSVWRKAGDRWRIVHHQQTPLPAQASS